MSQLSFGDMIILFQFDRTALETAQDSSNFHIVEYLKVGKSQ